MLAARTAVASMQAARSAWTMNALTRAEAQMAYSGDFEVVFQPIVDLANRTVIAYEALSRFRGGASPLAHFADPDRLGGDVDLEVIAVAKAVDAACALPALVPMTVNVSPLTLEARQLREIFATADRPVGIEITEHHRVTNYPRLRALIEDLSPWKVFVDGSGAGYSTFDHIRFLQPDVIKLSATLTAHLDSAESDISLIKSFVSMAKDSGGCVLASALESESGAARALDFGVALGQGFLFGRPEPASWFISSSGDPRLRYGSSER
jgi:EAL domain-containing protein (putative c-di-GMP-specific phosphodiesterase class I)